jgi:release factor H-coupled RctB family protein
MGNSSAAIAPHPGDDARKHPSLTNFYGNAAWIEGRAQSQIEDVLSIEGVIRIAAFPDLHPGRYGPVGVAVESSRLHPLLVGNDIGCGMSVFELDLAVRKIRVDKAADRLRLLEGDWNGAPEERLAAIGLDPHTFPASLGSIGGGNHFCELQMVHEKLAGGVVDPSRAYLLVHSGSRGFGEAVLSSVPQGSGLGVGADTDIAMEYLAKHDAAVKWASLNRRIIAERAAESLRADMREICDVPHNLVVRSGSSLIHYKGAACVGASAVAPVAGSRDTLSHIVLSTEDMDASLGGISHGAGRKYDRASMHHRVGRSRSDREAMERNQFGGRIVCEDRDLLLEEAGEAYKDAGRVVADLVAFGLVSHVASMRPLVTFKRARGEKIVPKGREKGRVRR